MVCFSFCFYHGQSFVADEKSATAKVLSGTRDIGACLFSTLESHFSVAVEGDRFFTGNKSLYNEQCNYLCERLKTTISSIVVHDAPFLEEKKLESPLHSCKYKVAAWFQVSRFNLPIFLFLFTLTIGCFMSSCWIFTL